MRTTYRAWLALFVLCAMQGLEAAVTADIQKAIRANTFEVVARKPENDPLTYEKALPLDLIPFIQRSDKYESIGTAFSLGGNTYVTAAHVLANGIGSQFGPPSLRSTDGKVHTIDRILEFSAHQDFVVFSLANDIAATGLSVSRTPKVDDTVLAVGNALGEGVVIRDGLFTSETPEDQDGRWKWIRFSAATSPGNSGGPLLDAEGRVIGVVVAKSPNENLNFALPIGRVLDATEKKASFDQRVLISLPFIRGTRTFEFKDEFKLPLGWDDFVKSHQALVMRHNDLSRADLLNAYADSIFPKGADAESILYGVDTYYAPRMIVQQTDLSWSSMTLSYSTTDLPGDGELNVALTNGGAIVHLVRPNNALDDAFYADSKAFMDIALKGLNLTRQVGSDQVRITSLGAALSDTMHTDRWGRKWQQRLWALPFMDTYAIGFLLPTPDGYIASITVMPSGSLAEAVARQKLLINQVDFSYLGRVDQWNAFLKRRALLPDALRDLKLSGGKEWRIASRRFELTAPADLISINEKSELGVVMSFIREGDKNSASWDVVGAWWNRDNRQKAFVGAWRQPLPPEQANLELRNTFSDMRDRRGVYGARFIRESSDTYQISMSVVAPGSKAGMVSKDLIYGLTLQTEGAQPSIDRQAFITQAPQALKIIEHGSAEEPLAQQPDLTTQSEALAKEAFGNLLEKMFASRPKDKDVRGRVVTDDYHEYAFPFFKQRFDDDREAGDDERNTVTALERYWRIAGSLASNLDMWSSFLARNDLDPTKEHDSTVKQLEKDLFAAFAAKQPSVEWAKLADALNDKLVEERRNIAKQIVNARKAQMVARQSACPPPAVKTSGSGSVTLKQGGRLIEEFYPASSRRTGRQGSVVINLKVSASGCATHGGVAVSSGDEDLDVAALRWYEESEFLPAENEGKPVESDKLMIVSFVLNKDS